MSQLRTKKFKKYLKDWETWQVNKTNCWKDYQTTYKDYWDVQPSTAGRNDWILPERPNFPGILDPSIKSALNQRMVLLEQRVAEIERMLTEILNTLSRLENDVNPSRRKSKSQSQVDMNTLINKK